jgi:predicted dinucleotide-binding enzyme
MRILLAGTGKLGVSLATPLLKSPHQIVGILQNGRQTKGTKRLLDKLFLGILVTVIAKSVSQLGTIFLFSG